MMRFIKKLLKFLLWTFIISTIIIVSVTYIFFVYVPDKQYKKALLAKPYNAIIVPGIPFDGKNWNEIMKARVQWAYLLYSKGITQNVIFSGSAVYTPFVESKIMALYAIEMGLPKENIFTETKAEHSTENLYYSYQIARNKGFKRVALATDPFQNLMLWNFKEDVSPELETIPIKFSMIKKMRLKKIIIDPSSAKVGNFVSLVKRESKWERFKGTLGRKIKK